MKKTLLISLLALSSSLFSNAFAGNTTGNFTSNATVNAVCNISADNMDWGDIQTIGSNATITKTSNINVFCSRSAAYNLNLSLGNTWIYPRRNMTSPLGDKIAYLLTAYNDAGGSGTWGYSYAVSGVGTASNVTHKVYGWIELTQFQSNPVRPGSFSDDVVATVTF